MERKIGEIFEYNGEWHQCVEQPEKYDKTVCNLCDFHGIGNCELDRCSGTYRSDKKDVVFKKLEKVGEPYMDGGKIMQKYNRVYREPIYFPYKELNCYNDLHGRICIEIKQTKEDMEENENNRTNCGVCGDNRFEVIARAKADLLKSTNIERDEK